MNDQEQKRLIAAMAHKILSQIHYCEKNVGKETEKIDLSLKGGTTIEFGIEFGSEVMMLVTSIMRIIDKLNNVLLVSDGKELKFQEKAQNIYLSGLVSTLHEFAYKLSTAVIPTNGENFSVKDKENGGWDCDFEVSEQHSFNIESMALGPIITMFLSSDSVNSDIKNKLIDDIRDLLKKSSEEASPGKGLKGLIVEGPLTSIKNGKFLDIYNGKERLSRDQQENQDIIDLLNGLP